MKVTRFDPDGDLIIVGGYVWSPDGRRHQPLSLVVDTGAAESIVTPDVLDELGYSARLGEQRTVRSAVGREEGDMIRVARFARASATTRRTFGSMHMIFQKAGASTD